VLRYETVYALLSSETSEVPVEAGYETLLAGGMIAQASPAGSKERKQAEADFESDILNAGKRVFTPSPEEARPPGVAWPAFKDDNPNTHEWTGD
jgi:hypothetical protein